MSASVDQFCDELRDRLSTVETRVNRFKEHIEAAPQQTEQALRSQLDEAHQHVEAQRSRIETNRANIRTWAEHKMAETKEAINDWKTRHERNKLNARADRAEVYAASAVEYALATIDEAEEAVFEAVVARHDADNA